MAAPAAGAAAGAAAAPQQVAGTQLTQDQAIAQLSQFNFGLTLEQYRSMCNQDPSNRLACDPNWRRLNQQDLQALLKAKSMGITLMLPFVPAAPAGDYVVQDPFNIIPTGLPKQLATILALKNGGSAGNSAADAAAAKAAADAQAQKEAAAKQAADAQAQQAAADAAAKTAADQAAAAAAAQKAAADAAAAAKANNDAQAAAAAKAAQDKAAADAAAAAAAQKQVKRGLACSRCARC